MTTRRRFLLLTGIFALITIVLVFRSRDNIKSTKIWRNAPQVVGLGDWTDEKSDEQTADVTNPSLGLPRLPEDPAADKGVPKGSHRPSVNKTSLFNAYFHPEDLDVPGGNYTKAVVLGRLLSENITWLETAHLPPHIQKYVYVVDAPLSQPLLTGPSIPLLLPKNKGHEAMVYLSYIIDHYSDLPDVSIFVHAHQYAWHNNELLNHDAVETIKRLSSERVIREGYMNLRCHWKPGCPEYIHPGAVDVDVNKQEETVMAATWAVLFPDDPIPDAIASNCCAQFAVSRALIQSIPLARFHTYREWLLKTELDDYVSGRVFEYLWHKIFTGYSTFCPDMRMCYCDGYGVCFANDDAFDYWFELKYRKREAERKLDDWRARVAKLERQEARFGSGDGGYGGLEELNIEVPIVDEDVVLQREIDGLGVTLEDLRLKALKAGTDPRIRAMAAGRSWKLGDGY